MYIHTYIYTYVIYRGRWRTCSAMSGMMALSAALSNETSARPLTPKSSELKPTQKTATRDLGLSLNPNNTGPRTYGWYGRG